MIIYKGTNCSYNGDIHVVLFNTNQKYKLTFLFCTF